MLGLEFKVPEMDFEGQKMAEILQYVILGVFGIAGFIWGYLCESFEQTFYVVSVGSLVASLLRGIYQYLTPFSPFSGCITSLARIPQESPTIPSLRGTRQTEESDPEKEEELETVGLLNLFKTKSAMYNIKQSQQVISLKLSFSHRESHSAPNKKFCWISCCFFARPSLYKLRGIYQYLTPFSPFSGCITSLARIPQESPTIPSLRGTRQTEESDPEKEEELETVGLLNLFKTKSAMYNIKQSQQVISLKLSFSHRESHSAPNKKKKSHKHIIISVCSFLYKNSSFPYLMYRNNSTSKRFIYTIFLSL
eukprot:sb/3467147/